VVTEAAYARCRQLARAHAENFPVASALLPRAMRPHVAAIYAFARIADDFADEGTRSNDERLALLDDWRRRLDGAASGAASDDDSDAGAVFTALGETIRQCRLDVSLFADLLSAFRQDVTVARYETWADLLDYCRRSANPVGRLVLRIAGVRDARVEAQSDCVCTALQLTNFWQDVERDRRKGRLYVPLALARAHGASEADLDRGALTPAWRAALGDAAARTRALFDEGRPVADEVTGRLRWELRATWLGGRRILDRLEACDFDVFHRRPSIGWRDAAPIGWGMITWKIFHHEGTKGTKQGSSKKDPS
jgi:phytoene synthase